MSPLCVAQEERLALIFTISVVAYSLPSILIGYMLHYAGLWATRMLARYATSRVH